MFNRNKRKLSKRSKVHNTNTIQYVYPKDYFKGNEGGKKINKLMDFYSAISNHITK